MTDNVRTNPHLDCRFTDQQRKLGVNHLTPVTSNHRIWAEVAARATERGSAWTRILISGGRVSWREPTLLQVAGSNPAAPTIRRVLLPHCIGASFQLLD